MNLGQLQAWLTRKAELLGRPLTLLHVGAGTGMLAPELRGLGLQRIRKMDGVEVWPGALEQGAQKEELYDRWFSHHLGELWGQLDSYDVVLFDGIHPFLSKKDFILLAQRASYLGDVICIEGYPVVLDSCPYDVRTVELGALNLEEVGALALTPKAYHFPKREGAECALVLRTFMRPFLTQASVDSLLKSWLPLSYLIIIDDCTPDNRMASYLDNLTPKHHVKHLTVKKAKSPNLFDTAQEAITSALALNPAPRWLGFCDTDFIYNPAWFQEALGRYEYLRRMHPALDLRAMTAFHLGTGHHFHPYEEVLETPYGDACLRKSSGWGNLLVEWSHAQRVTRVDNRRDGGYVADLLEGGGLIAGCIPSQVQHMGAFRSTMDARIGDWAPDYQYRDPAACLRQA